MNPDRSSHMDENQAWLGFRDQLQAHYEALEAYHRELGGVYEDSSSNLMEVLQAALQASLEATKAECDRVREDCESMLADMAMMRRAMGETSKTTGSDDPFSTNGQSAVVKTPLLDTQKVLRIEHTATRKSFDDRARKVTTLYDRLRSYVGVIPDHVICVDIPSLEEQNPPNDVSLSRLGLLDAACARCKQELLKRKQIVQALGREIVHYWAELAVETTALDENDRKILLDAQDNPERLGLMDEDIQGLEAKRDNLHAEKHRRRQSIDNLLTMIQSLHHKLRLPDAEYTMFASRARGFAPVVMELCENELARLIELKKDHIEDFIVDARRTLEALWDALYYNEDDRLDFSPAFTDIFTEASLQAHENEIARLQEQVVRLEPLLSLLARHMELMKEKRELELQTSDPTRFSRRGYNPMAESKMRTRIDHNLPRIEGALREAFSKHEEENLVPFRVWGEIYLPVENTTRTGSSKPDPVQMRSNTNLSDSLGRTVDASKKIKPRTPGALPRPATATSTKSQSQYRSTSTPVRLPGPNRDASRSPTKRSTSHQIPQSTSRTRATLQERSHVNVTKLPSRTKLEPSCGSAIRTIRSGGLSTLTARDELKSFKNVASLDTVAMAPPRLARPMANMSRQPSDESSASHLFTENSDNLRTSSSEMTSSPVDLTGETIRPKMPACDLTFALSPGPEAELADGNGRQEAAGEASFEDDWGDEGF